MDISNSGHVVLGMLFVGSRSGYEIRKSAELSLRHFWSISPPQIYTELGKLEAAGLVEGSDDHQGNRRRRLFTVTPAGREALHRWVLDEGDSDFEMRDLLQVKLFFADVLEPDEVPVLLEQIRARSRRILRKFEREVSPAARKTVERHGVRFPPRVADLHVELHQYLLSWCDRVEQEYRHGSD